MQMTFVTTTKNNEIYFDYVELEKFLKETVKLDFLEIEDVSQFARIEWEFYLETREWGIKNFGAYATKIAIDIHLEYYKKDEDETFTLFSQEISLTDHIKGFEIISETEIQKDCDLSVTAIEINFETKKITIEFN
jgi:hypothetical protein